MSPNDPNPGGVLGQTDPWQFSDSGLVAYHFADSPTIEQWVEYASMTGRSVSAFVPEAQRRGAQSVSLAPSGNRAVIAQGGLASVWDIDPSTGSQTYANLGFSYTENADGPQTAWQPRCTVSSSASHTTITGTQGADLICVRGDADIVRGLGGDDIIYVTGNGNTVRGAAGRDVLVVHGGTNVVRGGRNADVINVRDGARTGARVHGGTGVDVCIADQGDQLRSCRS
jgi:Ca2+-binding RTX toxin-like protein